jgi:catechol 2,3-dioxygenase-like lactoylglutathione lyase family enzyme
MTRQLESISPVLLVADVVKSADYYERKLGFALRLWGEPPNFAIARRDGISIMLNQIGAGAVIHPNAGYDGRYDVYVRVGNADALFAEIKDRGANIAFEPSDEPYLMREFAVCDLDGHLLAFGHGIFSARNHG